MEPPKTSMTGETALAERVTRCEAEIKAVSATLDALRDSLTSTIDMVREATDRRFAEADRRYQQRFDLEKAARDAGAVEAEKSAIAARDAAEKAIVKAETASEKRFDSMNEFRGQLRDQAATFLPRIEAEERMRELRTQVGRLQVHEEQDAGRRAGGAALYGWIIAGLGALATIIALVVFVSR